MLDENLPTFRYKPSSENPLTSVLYFTQRGDEPTPEYVFRRADPALPASRDKYAVALCDAYNPDVVYAEVTVEPEWAQPTLSAAEVRAQAQSGAPPAVAIAAVPESFTIQLYNPDQSVAVKMTPGGWNKSDSWEFEMPVQTFKLPSASELDRDLGRGSPADVVPRIMFRWKKDGRLSKDMTCYMCGKNISGRKNKEPDITVALFKAARESIVTVYEPNLHRVEVEDRKGLEVVLLLGAEVVKELYISPKMDLFNVSGSAAGMSNGGRKKNSRPSGVQPSPPPVAMSGAMNNVPPPTNTSPNPQLLPYTTAHATPSKSTAAVATVGGAGPSAAEIEAETRRLQAMVEREEREREKRERVEQKRIKKMLEEEEKEQRRHEAEIAKETERLRKKYGVEGQQLPASSSPVPPLPPRSNVPPQFVPPPPHWQQQQQNQNLAPWAGAPALPPRPVSAGPGHGPFHSGILNSLWHGPSGAPSSPNPPPPPHLMMQQQQPFQQQQPSGGGRTSGGGRRRLSDEDRRKVQKKRSMGW
ncbi:hypothetical protein B0H66DRAFT_553631 [Apodospora peruviana]|uniref:Uncharacterized protein n=1 Tax=Apodospora peruviana TaxID=516989 RepID=A0AAE0ICF6_9PEZI|nr:hypothetical protein B0H66DRAFT_553631 [Apodospora peruviana]